MLYAFFWVIPRCLNFICRRFGTLSHLHRPIKKEETECSETSEYKNSDAGELPRRKHTTIISNYQDTVRVVWLIIWLLLLGCKIQRLNPFTLWSFGYVRRYGFEYSILFKLVKNNNRWNIHTVLVACLYVGWGWSVLPFQPSNQSMNFRENW